MINRQAAQVMGINNDDYIAWCKATGRAAYKPETKRDFFRLIQSGKLKKTDDGKWCGNEENNNVQNA